MNFELIGLILIGGYLLGSIPTGYLIGKAKGIDIRQHGSKNIGATNVSRTLGKKYGIFVFVCDALKGVAAVLFAEFLSRRMPSLTEITQQPGAIVHHIQFMQPAIAGIMGAVACILGHNFPVWLKFKGGKGVATSLGVVVGLVPISAAIALAVWLALFYSTKYVSLASIFATISVPVTVALMPHGNDKTPLLIFTSLATLLIIVRHKANIVRLMNGTENRFSKSKKESE